MSKVSRSRLARAYVSLIGKHQLTRLNIVLAHYVVTSKMTNELDLLLSDINEELLRQHGQLEAAVVSARPLNQEIEADLKRLIKAKSSAKHVKLNQQIDKDILGGLVATTPSEVYDFSLITKLQGLKG